MAACYARLMPSRHGIPSRQFSDPRGVTVLLFLSCLFRAQYPTVTPKVGTGVTVGQPQPAEKVIDVNLRKKV
jgi:hypothetical protein